MTFQLWILSTKRYFEFCVYYYHFSAVYVYSLLNVIRLLSPPPLAPIFDYFKVHIFIIIKIKLDMLFMTTKLCK